MSALAVHLQRADGSIACGAAKHRQPRVIRTAAEPGEVTCRACRRDVGSVTAALLDNRRLPALRDLLS